VTLHTAPRTKTPFARSLELEVRQPATKKGDEEK
jgi:hypothetical protein